MIDDSLRALAGALRKFALWMDGRLGFPWPLTILLLFPLFIWALSTVMWWLRGTTFALSCDYQRVRGGQCRRPVPGEWFRCWQHRKHWQRKTDLHHVNPGLRRWQQEFRGQLIERKDVHGAGLLRPSSNLTTLLYYRGFARPPRDVIPAIPREIKKAALRVRETWRHLRAGSGSFLDVFHREERMMTSSGVSPVTERVVGAARVMSILVFVGLVMVLLSPLVREDMARYFEYVAAGLFIYAWSVAHLAMLHQKQRWWPDATKEALKWAGQFTVFAVVLGGVLQIGG